MRPVGRLVLVAVLLVGSSLWTLAEEKSWKGEEVISKKPKKDIKFGDYINGNQVWFQLNSLGYFTVREERDGRLRIFDGHREGWADKSDFVLTADAPAYFHDLVQSNPKDATALGKRGLGWAAKGEYDKAIKDYDECIRLDPKYADAYNNRANAYLNKEDYDRAIHDYDEAIRLDPKNAVAYYNRGNAYEAKNDHERAFRDYNKAIHLDPKDAVAYYNRGTAFFTKKDYDRALPDYDEAIRIDPKYADAYNSRGLAYLAKSDYDQALRDYNAAIQFDPKNASGYLGRAIAYAFKEDYNRALRDYDEAIQLDPKYALAYNNRAIAYRNKKDYDRAIRDYDEALRLDPKNVRFLNLRAWLLATCPNARNRDGRKAVADAKSACELSNWKDPNNLETLAAAYAEQGDFSNAVKYQKEAIDSPAFGKENREEARKRLKLYEDKKPYHEE
jgi:tetratricopeptide (TPR) repeat protein